MNFKQLFLLIISGLLTNIFCVSGQDMPLSIEQMFELCDQNSRNLKLSATEAQKARYQLLVHQKESASLASQERASAVARRPPRRNSRRASS